LEAEFGLQRLESAQRDRASRGYHPAEIEADARRRARGKFEAARRQGSESRTWWSLPKDERDGLVAAQRTADQPRWALARTVRACATASPDEAEFVRRMRRQGVLVRARYAEGTHDVVTGYSVAAKPEPGQRPIWYGGGNLARDLTLPRLRAEWPDTPQGASAAAAEWGAARRGRRPVAPGREVHDPDPMVWSEVGAAPRPVTTASKPRSTDTPPTGNGASPTSTTTAVPRPTVSSSTAFSTTTPPASTAPTPAGTTPAPAASPNPTPPPRKPTPTCTQALTHATPPTPPVSHAPRLWSERP